MASRSLSFGWCLTLGALVLGLTMGCGDGVEPFTPPPEKELPDAAQSTVVASRTSGVLANGKDSVTLTVTVRKADGAALAGSTVTLELSGSGNTLTPASGKTNAEGVMTATLTSTQPGSKQVTASVATDSAPVVLSSRPTVEFVPLQASKLAFTATSIQATAGAPLSPVLEVVLQDNDGATVRGATSPVTLALATGPASATLEGTLTVNAVDGVARFPNVNIKKAGSGYSVRATSGTLGAVTSVTFDVVPAAPSVLELSGLPASATAGDTLSASVTLKDAFANVATNYVGTLRFSSSDPMAQLPADYAFTPADLGTSAFFVELRTAGGQSVTVTDTANGTLTATAGTTVTAGAPARLVFLQQPNSTTVRVTLSEVRLALRDDYGNATTASAPTVTVGLTAGTGVATLSGTLNRAPVGGEVSFGDLSIDQESTGFQLVASATGLTGANSAAFNIVDNLNPAQAVITATQASATSVTVAWLAVGDDGNLGTASAYDLRYAGAPITNETEFAAATPFSILAPQAPGTAESATITGLNLSADVHVALKVLDGVGNSSRSASVKVAGDLCAGVVCTPPAGSCSADGTSTTGYTSACQPATGLCEDTPVTTRCQSYETCSAAACVPVTPGSQAGAVILSEFSALGAEFIELHNPTAAAIDVHGYTLRNAVGMMVDIRAVTDPNGTAGTPVTIPAGGYLHGVANPSGAIPPGLGFVYGAPGTTFALADTGDALALYRAAPAGNLEDAVDFRSFITHPNTVLTASHFVGFTGNSTQLEPTTLTAAGNDTATNWCVSFYAAGVRGSRIADTAGVLNGSCKVAVINEALIDASGGDDGKTYIEIAGPGGSVIGGARLSEIEGTGAGAGANNTFQFTFATGVRIPADGILLVADRIGATNNTAVPNFVAGVDARAINLDALEEDGRDSLQLISAGTPATLLDAVGYDPAGANLATNTAGNGLGMYETATALYMGPGAPLAASLSRLPGSIDTGNNRNDFRWDPSITPGLPNDAVNFTVAGITPDEAPNTVNSTDLTVTGTDFGPNMTMTVGANMARPCNVTGLTQAICPAVSSATPARVSVLFSNGPAIGAPDVTLFSAFTYTGKYNETNDPLEADYCNLQFPSSFSVPTGQMTPLIYGRIFEAGVTEAGGAPGGVVAEVGYGPAGADPTVTNTWRFFQATYNTQVGNDDEFQGSFVAPAAGSYSYTYRFSFDNGVRWTYCDLNGAGSDPNLTFEPASQLGPMTVNP